MSRQLIHAGAQARTHLEQPVQEAPQTFITTDRAALLLGQKTRAAFRMWAKRRRLTVVKDGRRWLVDRLDILAELERRKVTA